MAKKYIDESGLSVVFAKIKALIATKANATHSHDAATQSAAGFMSAADKKKLDGVASGANAITVDSGLSSTSTNPVQNKVINSALAGKADSTHGHGNATTGAAGFMSASDKSKLDGISSGANAYTHPTTSGNKHIPSGGSSGKILRWSADGTAVWGDEKDTVYTHPAYTARTGVPTADQTPGFGGSFNVTQPVSDAAGHITAMNSRKVTIPNTAATQSAPGLMSAADKTKLDGIATGANKTTVDSALSSTSTNPVQNKVIDTALAGKAAKKTGTFYIEGTGSTAGTWLGSHSDITEYYAGLMIAYKVGIAGATGTTLNINGLGAVAVVRNTTSAVTTHYGVGSVIFLTYTVDSDGTAYWKVSDYDSDTKTRSSNKSATKMFIIGATAQSTSGQTTYSNNKCYIGTDNHLYSNGAKVMNTTDYTAATTAEIDTALAAVE